MFKIFSKAKEHEIIEKRSKQFPTVIFFCKNFNKKKICNF